MILKEGTSQPTRFGSNMAKFRMSVDGLPRLESRLRNFRFTIKKMIAEILLEKTNTFLIPAIQEAMIEGDYLFKAELDEKPNLLDSLVAKVTTHGREIRVEVESTVNYAVFFEEGRPAGSFPSGEAYETENLTRWLEHKHGHPPETAAAIAQIMMKNLKENDNIYRSPDPVIIPTAKEKEEEYTMALAAALNARVEDLL